MSLSIRVSIVVRRKPRLAVRQPSIFISSTAIALVTSPTTHGAGWREYGTSLLVAHPVCAVWRYCRDVLAVDVVDVLGKRWVKKVSESAL